MLDDIRDGGVSCWGDGEGEGLEAPLCRPGLRDRRKSGCCSLVRGAGPGRPRGTVGKLWLLAPSGLGVRRREGQGVVGQHALKA